MRKRLARWTVGALSAFVLSLPLGASALQTAPAAPAVPTAPPAGASPGDQTQVHDDLPMLLLFLEHPVQKRRDDPTIPLKNLLNETLERSGVYTVLNYSPNLPIIKRATREHQLAASDLISPLSPATREKVARAIGAHYLLSVSVAKEPSQLRTTLVLEETVGPQNWAMRSQNEFQIPTVVGKRHLKSEELINLAVDRIAHELGIPSLLNEKLKVNQGVPIEDPKATKKAKNTKADKDPGKSADVSNSGTGGNGGNAAAKGGDTPEKTAAQDPSPHVKTTSGEGTGDGVQPAPNLPVEPNPTVDPGKKAPEKVPDKPAKVDKNTGKNARNGASKNTVPKMADETGLGKIDAVPSTSLGSPHAREKTDNEAAATRFRQVGDVANVIVSLRRAINERPRDIGLRRQLIAAYQDRQMPDMALSEANRALLLMPKDASLTRLCGDAMLAQGDMPGALEYYRKAIDLEPGNILSQVALGDALLQENKYSEAITIYEGAVKADPKSPLPHRRLGRAYAGRAGSDNALYASSLAEISKSRELTPASEADIYLEDYISLMRLMEARMRDMLDQAQEIKQTAGSASGNSAEINQGALDLKKRIEAISAYLEKLPPASGHDVTQAQYLQAAGLLQQTVGHLRDYLAKGETSAEGAFRSTQVDTRRALASAGKRLNSGTSGNKTSGDGA